jgi:uncharacterized protein involved in exopolysaccharide biosynthesis
MAVAEDKFRKFQENEKIYNVEVQTEYLVKNIAELEIQLIQLRIEKNQLLKSYGNYNNQVILLTENIKEVEKNIYKLKNDTNYTDTPLASIPEKGLKYFRYLRDIKIYEKVLEFLVPQLENARFEERKTASELQLLDRAAPEDYKSKPKRASIVIVSLFLSLITSVLFFLIKDYLAKNIKHIENIFSLKPLS